MSLLLLWLPNGVPPTYPNLISNIGELHTNFMQFYGNIYGVVATTKEGGDKVALGKLGVPLSR